MNPKLNNPVRNSFRTQAFTLVEMLVAVAVVMLMLLMLVQVATNVQKSFTGTVSKVEQFREARNALETISRRLSQAMLNTYWDYDNPTNPQRYLRVSNLRFECGKTSNLLAVNSDVFPGHSVFFQAPGGYLQNTTSVNVLEPDTRLEELLNTQGFYVQYLSDASFRPPFLSTTARLRYRLMALIEPTERFLHLAAPSNSRLWYRDSAPNTPHTRVLADNIIGMVFWPRLSRRDDPSGTALSTDYSYNSAPTGSLSTIQPAKENQLPQIISLTLVAIDEKSATRLAGHYSGPPPVWESTWFSSVSNYNDDIEKVRARLSGRDGVLPFGLEYRIFTTEIPLRSSRWSR